MLILALALTLTALTCHADTILLSEINNGALKQKRIRIRDNSFTPDKVERIALSELTSPSKPRFFQLLVFGQMGGAPLPKPSHLNYEHWRRLCDASSKSPNEIAELIALHNNAVLRVRDRSGNLTTRVLQGHNPLKFNIDGAEFEIVYLSLSGPNTSLILYHKLLPYFADHELSINIRNDSWVIDQPNYPFSNPFINSPIPPSAEDFSKSKTMKCNSLSGPATCSFE